MDFDTRDERSTFGYLLNIPLITQHGAFLYTTLSHLPQAPKARAVFITDAPFTDPARYRQAKRAIMARLPWGDASVHDPSRLFYGTHPQHGRSRYIGNTLALAVVDPLIEEHRTALEQEQNRRILPRIPSSRVMGSTPAERYVSATVQAEVAWVASQVVGTGQRHKGLLIAAMKLASLSLSEWFPAEARRTIDPYAALLTAAEQNGYIGKYGEASTRQTIADGIAYARPRPKPQSRAPTKPRLRWSGGQWARGVTV